MDYYCVNHTQEKAVGLCGTCQRPACYRCSLNVNQTIFCSLECFNKLSPPSAPDMPAMRQEVAVPAGVVEAARLDEYSDVMAGLTDVSEVVMPAAAADEPSVILRSDQVADPTTMLGMNPVHGVGRDGSTLILIPGTRRAVMSSSCYFHPDTSAITLCSKCRSPICSLCAKETPAGLTCSPDCGPPDPVGDLERRKFTIFNFGLGLAGVLVLVGAILLMSAAGQPEPLVALKPSTPATAEPVVAKVAPIEAPKPEPVKIELPPAKIELPPAKVEPPPIKVEPTQVKVETPPVKVETPLPEPAAPAVEPSRPFDAAQGKPEPLAKVVPPAPPPAPPPPPPVREPTLVELDLRWAAGLLREATPLLREVTEAMHPEWKPGVNLHVLATKLSTVELKLRQAREIYALRMKAAPDPALLGRRIDSITEVLEGLQSGFEQIRDRDRVVGKWRK